MKLLVSACLLDHKVRYDGSDKDRGDMVLKDLVARGCAVPFCPEVVGGLSVPRLPAEIQRGDGDRVIASLATVIDRQGNDVTETFLTGAREALAFAQREGIRVAILKSNRAAHPVGKSRSMTASLVNVLCRAGA
jgi:uncharacterized protein YbbK (DUF523 family)